MLKDRVQPSLIAGVGGVASVAHSSDTESGKAALRGLAPCGCFDPLGFCLTGALAAFAGFVAPHVDRWPVVESPRSDL